MDNDKRVRALLNQVGNLDCADCGATGKTKIKFCSVKLGVFLCNQCYAAHRALGAHITRGKCLGLDGFTDAEVDLLGRLGNRRVNAHYEATLPLGVKPPPTVCPGCSSSSCTNCHERLEFIQKKYEKKLWYSETLSSSAVPDPVKASGTTTVVQPAKQNDPFGLYQVVSQEPNPPSNDDFFASFGL
jgi:stromal membrane-associated protein